MFKHKAIVAAVLSLAAFSAQAGSQIAQDPYVFYAPNPVADPAPTPPDFKRAEIQKDLSYIYPNPVADPAPTRSDFKYSEIDQDPYVFYGDNAVAGTQSGSSESTAHGSGAATPTAGDAS